MIREILLAIEKRIPRGMRHTAEQAYRALPPSIRFGKEYVRASKFLARSQRWTKHEHETWQLGRLHNLVQHAYSHSRFYRQLYDSHGVNPSALVTLDDLRHFPTVSKDDLRSSRDDLRVDNFPPRKFQYHTTGGSTGKPVGLFWEADRTVPLERAFMRRQFAWVGFDIDKDRSVALRGLPVRSERIFEELPGNQIRLSSYDMTPANLDMYVRAIDDFRPIAILAYPSAAFILAQHVLRNGGHRFEGLRVVLCGSENIYDWQRDTIAAGFGCRAYSWYGQSEYVSLGGECEHSTDYHFYCEYGVTEIIRSDGGVAQPGETGEIVATGFNNFAFPLIRFRTEDIARVSMRTSCECGRNYPLVASVEGRIQEMIVARGGNLISMTAINMHSNVFDNVSQFQFYQDTPGLITLKIVRRNSFQEHDMEMIRAALHEKLRDLLEVEFQFVESIELTPRGKATFLIQKLPIPSFTERH